MKGVVSAWCCRLPHQLFPPASMHLEHRKRKRMATILVVEDERDLCNLIRGHLEAVGHTIIRPSRINRTGAGGGAITLTCSF